MSDDEKWAKISKEMEEYANSLEGEDEYLQSHAGEAELEEDAAKKKKPKAGSSNAGKYKTKGPYCGKAGGADPKSYPVNTRKRAIAALAFARHAPNPAGIKKCVCRHWPNLPACKKKKKSGDLLTDMWYNI